MQIVCWAEDYREYKRGDVCFIMPDGKELGRDVDPATAPSSSPYVVLRLPNNRSTRRRLRYLLRIHIDPLVPFIITPRPGHPDGDNIQDNIIGHRRFHFDPQRLPSNRRGRWRAQRRIDLADEAEFEFAIRDRENNDQPVDRTRLRRT